MSKAIGIDLGTTNTVVSVVMNGEAVVIKTSENLHHIPSAVCYDESISHEFYVGQQARNMEGGQPDNVVYSVKRLMGMLYMDELIDPGRVGTQDRERFMKVKAKLGYRLVPDPRGRDDDVRILLGKDCYLTPVEVSAKILVRAREEAERFLKEPVTAAVITVPAYFEQKQIEATKRAGEMAGLEVLRILGEPTAAALAAARTGREKANYVLVYDLGGGTFDVSLLQASTDARGEKKFAERSLGGNNWLGGDDFDQLLMAVAAAHIEALHGYNPINDRMFRAKIRPDVEQAKKTLSNRNEAVINAASCCCIPMKGGGSRLVSINDLVVTREEFEKLISPQLDETLRIVDNALKSEGGVPKELVDEVLLVGGSTYIPCVRRAVESLFPAKVRPVEEVNPMHCVAQGAAILADLMSRSRATQVAVGGAGIIPSVTPFALGVAMQSGNIPDVFAPIIPRGTRMPMKEPLFRKFQATKPTHIFLPVYAGEEAMASRNRHQGNIEIDLHDDPVPTGTDVMVGLQLTQDRIVEVTIRIKGRPERIDSLRCRGPEEDSWREDLEQHIHAGRSFLSAYAAYMSADSRDRLERILTKGDMAITEENRTEGRICTRQIARNLVGLDELANLLFKAEHLQRNLELAQDFRHKLGAACQVAKRTYHENQRAAAPETAARLEEIKKELEVVIMLAARHVSSQRTEPGWLTSHEGDVRSEVR